MFELTISSEKNKRNFMNFIYNKLKYHVENSKGLIIFEELDGRIALSLAVPEKEKDFYKAFTLELVSEIIVMDYKYDYIKDHLQKIVRNDMLWQCFLKALTVFDKQTDKDLIKKNLVFDHELLIDSSYHFKMWEVRNRWKEISSLVEENLTSLLSKDGFVDLMKFLISASDNEADSVFLKNCKNELEIMINDSKKATNLCFFAENVDVNTRILCELICLCPRKIIIDIDPQRYGELVDNISNIFEGRVHLNLENKNQYNYFKSVDNRENMVYNN